MDALIQKRESLRLFTRADLLGVLDRVERGF
jgi:hypothetical protein